VAEKDLIKGTEMEKILVDPLDLLVFDSLEMWKEFLMAELLEVKKDISSVELTGK
jgi:hypothetical protein